MDVRQVVVLRPGALGDTLLTCEALRALRDRFPLAHIELVGNRGAGLLLRDADLVDRVTSFDSSEVTPLFGPVPSVPQRWQNADVAIVWLGSSSTVAETFGSSGFGVVIAAHPEPERTDVHVADHLAASLAPLGIGVTSMRKEALLAAVLPPPRSARARAPQALLHPGSGAARKNWPPTDFAALARHLTASGWEIAWLRGPADDGAVAAVGKALGERLVAVRAPADLNGLVQGLANARVFVGNDSGVSHLSARLGLPTVAIFGATEPAEWAPRGPRVAVVGNLGSWPSLDEVASALDDLVS